MTNWYTCISDVHLAAAANIFKLPCSFCWYDCYITDAYAVWQPCQGLDSLTFLGTLSVDLLNVSRCNVLPDSKDLGKCVMIQYLSDPACRLASGLSQQGLQIQYWYPQVYI